MTNIDLCACVIPNMPESPALAMAYVPMQQLKTIYSPETALLKGTLYPELDKPFCGKVVMGGAKYA